MINLVLRNGTLVDPVNGVFAADVAVEDGKIAAILAPGQRLESMEEIDLTGKHVFPGVIEPHTHMGIANEFAHDVRTETASAALGGVTTVFTFHRHYRGATPGPYSLDFPELVELVKKESHTDFCFHLGILIEQQKEELEKYIDWGVSSFKFYMAYRGSDRKAGMLNEMDDGLMLEAFKVLAKHPRTVACVHCENTEIIGRSIQSVKDRGETGLPAWNAARPSFAEAEHVRRAGYFAELAGCALYYVHIGAKASLEEALAHRQRHPSITVETCPHYLTVTEDSSVGQLAKVNPPVRKREDLERVWQGLLRGEISTVGTDHCAVMRAKKMTGDIWTAAAGFPGMATLLPVMLTEGHFRRGMQLQQVAQVTSYNVAKTFNLLPRKGTLNVGSDADFAVVDLQLEKTVDPRSLGSSSDFSLQEGETLRGWPVMTILRGRVVAKDGELVAPRLGTYISR